jgi:hypothetical protein
VFPVVTILFSDPASPVMIVLSPDDGGGEPSGEDASVAADGASPVVSVGPAVPVESAVPIEPDVPLTLEDSSGVWAGALSATGEGSGAGCGAAVGSVVTNGSCGWLTTGSGGGLTTGAVGALISGGMGALWAMTFPVETLNILTINERQLNTATDFKRIFLFIRFIRCQTSYSHLTADWPHETKYLFSLSACCFGCRASF